MKYLQWSFWVIGLTLQYMLVTALMLGPYKEFPVLFGYSLFLVVTTVADIAIYLEIGNIHEVYRRYYWTAELVRQSMLYVLVISLVMRAMPSTRRRSALIRLLILLAFLFWSGSLAIHFEEYLSSWMTAVVRNLSFCSALVTLILWFILIASEKRDIRLLVITGGLGLQVTGEAIGQSLRQISRPMVIVGSILIVLTHFLCLYIWWKAFQPQMARDVLEQREQHNRLA